MVPIGLVTGKEFPMSRGWVFWMGLSLIRLALALTAGMALAERLAHTMNRVRWMLYLVR